MSANLRPFSVCDANADARADANANANTDTEPVAFCVTCPCRGRVPFCACGLGHEDPEDNDAAEELEGLVPEIKQQIPSAPKCTWSTWITPNWKQVALAAGVTALLMYAAIRKPAPLMRLQSFVRAV